MTNAKSTQGKSQGKSASERTGDVQSPGRSDPLVQAQQTLKRAAGFADDMRRQGIHVGWGSPPRCVVDGQSWPCAHERRQEVDA